MGVKYLNAINKKITFLVILNEVKDLLPEYHIRSFATLRMTPTKATGIFIRGCVLRAWRVNKKIGADNEVAL